ncbi:hypothetical protein NHJ13734_004568 [Beauveria thailandica]
MRAGMHGIFATLTSQTTNETRSTAPTTTMAIKDASLHRPGFSNPVSEGGIRTSDSPSTRRPKPGGSSISVHRSRQKPPPPPRTAPPWPTLQVAATFYLAARRCWSITSADEGRRHHGHHGRPGAIKNAHLSSRTGEEGPPHSSTRV